MLSLLRQRDYALLWWSALISGVGNFILVAALPYYVYSISGSTLASGTTFISETVPMVLFSSIGGIFADRWRRKRAMLTSDYLRGLILLPLLAVHSTSALPIVYLVGFLGASVANFTGPFGNAALPHIVTERELPGANAAFSAGGFLAVLIGSSLGALLLQHVGLAGVVIADVASFALSALLITQIHTTLEEHVTPRTYGETVRTRLRAAWQDWLRGVQFVVAQRWIAAVFLVMMLVFPGNSMIAVCLAPFVRHVLHGSAQIYADVLIGQGIGGVIASIFMGGITRRIVPERMLAGGILLLGAINIAIAVAARVSATLALAVVSGGIILFGVASMNTLVQARVADSFRGRVSGAFLTASASMSLTGSLIASASADIIGIRLMLGIGAAIFILASLVAFGVMVPLVQAR